MSINLALISLTLILRIEQLKSVDYDVRWPICLHVSDSHISHFVRSIGEMPVIISNCGPSGENRYGICK